MAKIRQMDRRYMAEKLPMRRNLIQINHLIRQMELKRNHSISVVPTVLLKHQSLLFPHSRQNADQYNFCKEMTNRESNLPRTLI